MNVAPVFKPNLILLDVHLDNDDGREICRLIKSAPLTASIPVILFSANPNSLKDYASYGASACIEKPFNKEELIEKINLIIHDKKKKYGGMKPI